MKQVYFPLLVKLVKQNKKEQKQLGSQHYHSNQNTIYQKSSITMVSCCHGIQTWQSLPWQLGGSPWLISSSMEEMETLSRWMRASVTCTCLFRSALGSIFDQSIVKISYHLHTKNTHQLWTVSPAPPSSHHSPFGNDLSTTASPPLSVRSERKKVR